MIGLKRTLATALLITVSFGALADETITTYTFDSLSKIEYGTPERFTGVLVNESIPTTVALPGASVEQCRGFYITMLQQPGMYILSVTIRTTTYPPTAPPFPPSPPDSNVLTSCSLERKP